LTARGGCAGGVCLRRRTGRACASAMSSLKWHLPFAREAIQKARESCRCGDGDEDERRCAAMAGDSLLTGGVVFIAILSFPMPSHEQRAAGSPRLQCLYLALPPRVAQRNARGVAARLLYAAAPRRCRTEIYTRRSDAIVALVVAPAQRWWRPDAGVASRFFHSDGSPTAAEVSALPARAEVVEGVCLFFLPFSMLCVLCWEVCGPGRIVWAPSECV